jgi:hypothetical protein
LVSIKEEASILFKPTSSLADENHPERKVHAESIEVVVEAENKLVDDKSVNTKVSKSDVIEGKLDDEEAKEVEE